MLGDCYAFDDGTYEGTYFVAGGWSFLVSGLIDLPAWVWTEVGRV